jgi:hypothetical protein
MKTPPSRSGRCSSTLARVTGECKNCGTALAGRYCSECGQAADVRIPSFGRVAADALGDLYNFDSRMWRSLLTLVREPGRLTSRFLDGQRARYTPPFRLYAAASILFFLLFSLGRLVADPAADRAVTEGLSAAGAPALEELVPEVEVGVAEDSFILEQDDDGWHCNFVDENTDPALRERLEAACEKIERDTSGSFARAIGNNVPVMMLVFIPLVAALMRVLYLFAGRKYVEHLVFFLHLHALFFVTGITVIVLSLVAHFVSWLWWPVLIVQIAAWVYFPVYVYRAMRHVYRQGHALTAVKYVSLGLGYFVALLFTVMGLFAVTVATL